jgi:hypothetical protein
MGSVNLYSPPPRGGGRHGGNSADGSEHRRLPHVRVRVMRLGIAAQVEFESKI